MISKPTSEGLYEIFLEINEKYLQIINISPNAIFIAQNEKVIFTNPKTWELTGYSAEEFLHISCMNFIHPQDHSKWQYYYQAGIDGKKIDENITCRFIKKSGHHIWVELVAAPIIWDQQPGILFFARDITPEKRLMAQLQYTQKIEAIGMLAGGIAHNFNNILSAILMNTEMVLLNLPENSPFRTSLEDVFNSSISARELVNQILRFSHQNERERVSLNISVLVTEALKLLKPSLPSTIEIRLDIRTQADMILADPADIYQVLIILCLRATDAMRESGGILTIGIEGARSDMEASIPSSGLFPDGYVKLSVHGTGRGIDQQILQRIFDPYYTTTAQGGDPGPGLSVVDDIVKTYYGTITVDGKSGTGTTFEVYFPRLEPMHELKSEMPDPIPSGNENIFFIDDEMSIVESFTSILKYLKYHITTETNSLKALEYFRSNPNKFDVIITDQTMPHMTGYELAQEFIKIRPDIPIILCTGSSELNNEQKAKIGVRSFIMKPVDIRKLAILIRKILDKK